MRTSTTLVAVATSMVLGANAINLAKRSDGPPRVVAHPIYRKHIADPIARISQDRNRMRKRQNTVSVSLDNEETLYFMNATIGTPPQSFQLHLDTGSSDLWMNVANSEFCSDPSNQCSLSGTYDANSSSTYTYLNSDFNISYEDGSGSAGDYATDTVRFAGVTLEGQQLGIGYESSSAESILGIGYPTNEVAVAIAGGSPYPNVPQNMMDNGVISTNAYSLWLNDLDASTGQILFGGVNTEQYTGSLETVPIVQEDGEYAEFIIALTGVSMNGSGSSLSNGTSYPALLDSGSSLIYLPNAITQDIYTAFDAQYDSSQGAAFVDCDLANSGQTIDFTFSSPTIRVGLDELVILAGIDRGREVCILGIGPTGDSTPVLGDTFLRSAYVVYDITNNEISLAQTKFNTTSDNVLEITNSTGVPDATLVPNAVTSLAVASGGARDSDGSITGSSFAQATAPPSYNFALLGVAGAAAMFAL